MNKKSQLKLKAKLNELFKEPEDLTAPIELCGNKLINQLKTYSKEEIDYILNNEYYLIKLISRLNDYPESMWSGRMLRLFRLSIKALKNVKKHLSINYKITPKILINSLDIESLIEMFNFLEEKKDADELREELNSYLNELPGFINIATPISERTKTQHKLLISQVVEKVEGLEDFFNYNDNYFINLKKIRMYEKIHVF